MELNIPAEAAEILSARRQNIEDIRDARWYAAEAAEHRGWIDEIQEEIAQEIMKLKAAA